MTDETMHDDTTIDTPACGSEDCACDGESCECAASKAVCPLKRLGKGDITAGVVTAIFLTAATVLSVYAQYVLTKWAVKSALKETRLR
ncbi:hypothetical protein D2E25_0208 [Bifidobacterium goeldii]|uniref:Uncharacterized protein n=1 Tax=Bifidobacterium goeldii TaxID=2306975 RepID=A0A430FMF7_9BIFI|nr:hypothetical protein [Bifidobacterium goeldii]RSX53902.1 hypothetical protein D2E25_0208 [Bifidobacterium goeldii]